MTDELTLGWQSLPLRHAYPFLESNGLNADAQSIRDSNDRVGGYGTATLRRARVVALLNSKGLLEKFITECWPNGTTDDGRRRIKNYTRIYERWMERGGTPHEDEDQIGDEGETRFAQEDDLRDYLAQNLRLLEEGMALWPVGEGQDAVEFVVDDSHRRIEILAKDRNGIPVVIELKVSQGHERTIGQSLYYRARVKQILKAKKVRIIIVAREITPELKAATAELQDASLFEYRLSMTVRRV